ncbi:hypothetical protein LINPERHAP1_LOCUS37910 [Linum perenne]
MDQFGVHKDGRQRVAYSMTLLAIVSTRIRLIWESAPSQEQRSVELLKVFERQTTRQTIWQILDTILFVVPIMLRSLIVTWLILSATTVWVFLNPD